MTPSWRRQMRYGLTQERFEIILDEQGGLCAICREKPPVDVDHNRANGCFRGLLCRACNLGLGMFKDDPARMESAISYLKTHIVPLKHRIKRRSTKGQKRNKP